MIYSAHRPQNCSLRRLSPAISAAPLARAVRQRRHQLRLSLDQAARGSGFSIQRWMQLENGSWIPDQFSDMDAIAGALGEGVAKISFLCLLSSANNTGQK
jgi:transcriptional regulator with XRE-family HTH domain